MDVYSFFSEMEEVETQYGHWLLGAVGAGGHKPEIVWDQYLEVRVSGNLVDDCADALLNLNSNEQTKCVNTCIDIDYFHNLPVNA